MFSPDGQIIALASSRIRFWDVHTYQLILELKNPYGKGCTLSSATFSGNGDFFAVSTTYCWDGEQNPPGHLLVWDLRTGSLVGDWDQDYAAMNVPGHLPYSIPVYAMAFLPNSTKIAYATGNSIEIRDKEDPDENPIILSLGKDMYATEISVRDDSQYLFALMEWDKSNTFPSFWKILYRLQSWHLGTNRLNFILDYPKVNYTGWSMSLLNGNLINQDFENGTLEVRNLSTNNVSQFPFRSGWIYFNSDMSLMIYARLIGFDDDEKSFELWDTSTWRNIYTFLPDFGPRWVSGTHNIAFSPDNTILAIEHQERVSLWNINSIINPNPAR